MTFPKETYSYEDEEHSPIQLLLSKEQIGSFSHHRKAYFRSFLVDLCFNIGLAIYIVFMLASRTNISQGNDDLDLSFSIYSPALEAVEYEWMKWPNAFAQPSPYRGTPTTELEQAWEKISSGEQLSFSSASTSYH
ncbi:hypothetical protein LZ30DRAFT_684774 [Colletotrichum cereale]|nr:hypothetical protein LZ30DRAFT_684774 [Colletotrichum cereale]